MKKTESDDFYRVSYNLHEKHWNRYLKEEDKVFHSRTWFDKDTVDYWRHLRMYKTIDPLLESFPRAKWLTIGDGRYGNDAHYLESKGAEALATDISDALLRIGAKEEFIKSYKQENAESLSFPDNEYDFVLCKESYHHFPRPMVALYEMLRVVRKAVILIEPNDTQPLSIKKLIRSTRRALGQDKVYANFEEVGNYVYTVSRHELEKVALGLGYRYITFKGLNDHYLKGVEYEKANASSELFKKVKSKIALLDWLCRLKFIDYNLLVAIIFKGLLDSNLQKALSDMDYKLVSLPTNPHLENKG